MGSLIISRTPLRVSFFGGGSDLPEYYTRHGGRVLSCTIDKYVYVAVKCRWDGHVVVNTAGASERVRDRRDLRNGIVREAPRLTDVCGGVEITTMSDVPAGGSGLGSSSAFAVGLMQALAAYQGQPTTAAELAELACHLEIDLLGAPIGKQDQYAVAHGGCREYRFHPDGSVTPEPVVIEDSPYGVRAARLAGMRCIAVPYLPADAADAAVAAADLVFPAGGFAAAEAFGWLERERAAATAGRTRPGPT